MKYWHKDGNKNKLLKDLSFSAVCLGAMITICKKPHNNGEKTKSYCAMPKSNNTRETTIERNSLSSLLQEKL